MFRCYIDVGHGGVETSTVIKYGEHTLIERDVNLVMATALQGELKQYIGVETLLSRQSNDGSVQWDAIGVDASAGRCREWQKPEYGDPVKLLISCHWNGGGEQSGYQIIHSVKQPAALSFAIGKEFDGIGVIKSSIYSRQTGGGIWTSTEDQVKAPTQELDYYGIIRETITNDTQSIIMEFGFLDSWEDVDTWLWDIKKGEYRMDKIRQLVEAVARGIAKYFTLYKVEVKPEPVPVPIPEPKPTWKGIQKLSATFDRIEGDKAVIEVVINGHIRMIDIPVKEA